MNKYFDLIDKRIHQDLQDKGWVDLQNQNKYHMDYGNCTFTCFHHKLTRKNIEIPGIAQGDLCFILPLILPNLPSNNQEASKINSSKVITLSFLLIVMD